MGNIVDTQTGKIKRSELMKSFYDNAPKMEEKLILEKLIEFFKENSNADLVFLNSKLVNFLQFFELKKDATPEDRARYILGFIDESVFYSSTEEDGSVVFDTEEGVPLQRLNDIRDIFFTGEDKSVLAFYAGSTYFTLSDGSLYFEKMEDFDNEGK